MSLIKSGNNLRQSINDLVLRRFHSLWLATMLSRTFFFAGAAAVAGICQYTTWPANGSPTTSQVIGIGATIVAFISAAVALISDQDATQEIRVAHQAFEKAEGFREDLEETLRLWPDVEQMISLFQVISLFRDQAESASTGRISDEIALLSSMLTLVKRQLPAAVGLKYSDPWTICIYRAVLASADQRYELKLVEDLRAIECAKNTARSWPEGRGVAGVAFSNSSEIMIADLAADAAQAVFKPSGLERDYDDERYRSMVAIPIFVQGDERPWGIVTATSAVVGHFNHAREDGLKNVDGIRTVARYSALMIAIARCMPSPASPLASATG